MTQKRKRLIEVELLRLVEILIVALAACLGLREL